MATIEMNTTYTLKINRRELGILEHAMQHLAETYPEFQEDLELLEFLDVLQQYPSD